MKKAVVAENLESLVKKGRHIFNEIVLINISNSARLDGRAGGDHHSLLPRGPGSSLVFTSMKSECPAYARGGGGGVRGFK